MTAATDRHTQYFAGWPCAIAASVAKGRHLIALRDFAQGETVLVSEAYLTALLSSHKKRICAACLHDCGRRLTVHCGSCDEAWYCSEACREAHAAGAAPSGDQCTTTPAGARQLFTVQPWSTTEHGRADHLIVGRTAHLQVCRRRSRACCASRTACCAACSATLAASR